MLLLHAGYRKACYAASILQLLDVPCVLALADLQSGLEVKGAKGPSDDISVSTLSGTSRLHFLIRTSYSRAGVFDAEFRRRESTCPRASIALITVSRSSIVAASIEALRIC